MHACAGLLMGLVAASHYSATASFGRYGTLSLALSAQRPYDSTFVTLSDIDFDAFWNAARCDCQSAALVALDAALTTASAAADSDRSLEIWIGSDCAETAGSRSSDCGTEPVATIALSKLAYGTQRISFDASRLIAPPDGNCTTSIQTKRTLWALLDENGDGKPDLYGSISNIPADTEPPPVPSNTTLAGAKNRVVLQWSLDGIADDRKTDIAKYQALCTLVQTTPSLETKLPKDYGLTAHYVRGADVCKPIDASATSTTGSPIDAKEPSPEFLCGEGGASDTELDVDLSGLPRSASVRVRLVVIDPSGNYAVARPSPNTATEVDSQDFWQVYQGAGGEAQGCSDTASVRRPARISAVIADLLLLFLVILAAHRRLLKKRRLVKAAAVIALLLLPGSALGEPALRPDPDEEADARALARIARLPKSRWAIELEAGPYTPEVDRAFAHAAVQPYARVFGTTPAPLFRLELDRFLAWPWGELGLGISMAYMQKSAHACVHSDDPAQLCAERSALDRTTFRLMPLSILALYRFTRLADLGAVPIVPYAKLGLAIDPWFVSAGDGSISGRGLTYGISGALGLSLRIDEVDIRSAEALQAELGIEHTSLTFEMSRTEAPLFHRPSALDVGATTWTAGLLIEL